MTHLGVGKLLPQLNERLDDLLLMTPLLCAIMQLHQPLRARQLVSTLLSAHGWHEAPPGRHRECGLHPILPRLELPNLVVLGA